MFAHRCILKLRTQVPSKASHTGAFLSFAHGCIQLRTQVHSAGGFEASHTGAFSFAGGFKASHTGGFKASHTGVFSFAHRWI